MGKRKSKAKKPQGPKKNTPLPTSFNCLFCNHEDAVTCKLDKKLGVGSLQCKICGQTFQSHINYLSHAVDVYSEWVDACDEIANKGSQSKRGTRGPKESGRRDQDYQGGGAGGGSSDLDGEDDDIPRGSHERSRPAPIGDDGDDDDEEDF